MTTSAVIWVAATGVSLAAHAGAAALLVWMTMPQDVPQQTTPETQMQLAAFQVPQSDAAAAEPEADSLPSSDVEGAKLGQGVVPVSRAEVAAPRVESAAPLASTGNSVGALDAVAPSVSAKEPPTSAAAILPDQSERLAVSEPETERAALQSATAQSLPEAQIVATMATAASVPVAKAATPQLAALSAPPQALEADNAVPLVNAAQRVVETQPQPQLSEPSDPETQTAAPLPPDTQMALNTPPTATAVVFSNPNADPAPSLAPPTTSANATLVFPGQGDGPVDPVSLAAFQSFMAPNDLGAAAADVKDSISGVLSSVPCSRLQARFDPDANAMVMTGHVPEDSARLTVLSAMQEKMGADIPVRENLLVLPRPQCGALTGISEVGLPQSTDQITNPLLLGDGTHVREFTYTEGQALVLNIQGADYDAYVYVDFFDADGNVVHLKPNEFRPLENTPAKAALQIGSPRPLNPGEPGLYIKIGPPFGQEIAVAFAASEPLYDGVRPLVEPAEPYLDWLQDRVTLARETHPDFKGEWVYFFISTGPNP